jgi:hypothetical protein
MTEITVNNTDEFHLPDGRKLLNVVVPSADVHKIEYKGRVPLTIEVTTYHAARCRRWHHETERLFAKVIPDRDGRRSWIWVVEYARKNAGSPGTGELHVAGLIDLILKFQDLQIPIAVIHPEAGLHPKIVLPLTDVLIELAWRGADEELKFEMLARKAVIQ